MKIFLVQADQKGQAELVFPLGLCYVGSVLDANAHEVEVFDPNAVSDADSVLKLITRTPRAAGGRPVPSQRRPPCGLLPIRKMATHRAEV